MTNIQDVFGMSLANMVGMSFCHSRADKATQQSWSTQQREGCCFWPVHIKTLRRLDSRRDAGRKEYNGKHGKTITRETGSFGHIITEKQEDWDTLSINMKYMSFFSSKIKELKLL